MKQLLQIFRADGILLTAVALTAVFGLVGLASLALRNTPADFSTFTRQCIAILFGITLFVIGAKIDWRAWERWWPLVAIGVVLLLVGVLVFGVRIRGTKGWFPIGPLTLQPVEFAKIALILLQAAYFRRRARQLDRFRTILESASITGVLVALVLLQPDFGSAALLVVTWLGMLLVFGLQRTHLLVFAVTLLITAATAWFFVLAPYQRDRVLTVLDPNRDPQGAGYNQRQAVIAIGAGGVFGLGFAQGTQAQLRFLPEAQSDFLPAVIGEEFGFLGIMALMALIVIILARCYAVSKRCHDDFSASIIVGMGVIFGFQAMYNLAMNLGVVPVTGIPFPFVSSGGSAIMAFAFGFGIIASIALRTPRAERKVYELHVIE
ncbi:MAG: FtsW/RodA/SpoVE family cell cycle protein [Candidatus Uhrbacteria bacterium]